MFKRKSIKQVINKNKNKLENIDVKIAVSEAKLFDEVD